MEALRQENSPPLELSKLVDCETWRRREGSGVFPTKASLSWFIQQHREELKLSGHFLPGRGSGRSLVGPGFGEAALAILLRERLGESTSGGNGDESGRSAKT